MGWFGKTEKDKSEITKRLHQISKYNNGDVHVIPSQGKWSVRKEGANRASCREDSKSSAISIAKRLLGSDHSKVVVHNHDGTISE